MTKEQAAEYARELYDDHPAAAALILEAVHGETDERQYRSAQALRWLDPMEDVGELATPGADTALRALRWCLLGQRLRERKRAAPSAGRLLSELAR